MKENMKIKTILLLSFFLILISGIYLVFVSLPLEFLEEEATYTSSYERVNVDVAKQLIETDLNLTVVDCTGGCQSCVWKNGKLPRAEWIESSLFFYNTTEDLLVYSYDGTKSITFCEQLVNYTYGKIYHLDGGLIVWKEK